MFASRSIHRFFLRSPSSFFHSIRSKKISQAQDSIYAIRQITARTDDFPSSAFGSYRWMSSGSKRSMRGRVERRVRMETGKTQREIRRAKKLKKKLMTEEERLVYNLKRVKRKVALLLQKLKKYELPELPPPKHDPELFTPEQLQAFKKIGYRNKNYVPVGVRGVFGGVVQNMHLHWKFHETVQVCCDNFPKERIKEMATMLARLSGGIVINIHNVKTIIMFRGRNYRQPKMLIPTNTLTKRKALFKARFEQALESQKLNIKKYEQRLRQLGFNPDDPVAIESARRVASTLFNAIDNKDGTPYVFRQDEASGLDSLKSLEQSDPADESEQEDLDKFIAEIEEAANKEWAEQEAAEEEVAGEIRYLNRARPRGGRFMKPASFNVDESDDEMSSDTSGFRGRDDRRGRQIVAYSEDDEDEDEDEDDDEDNDDDFGHRGGRESGYRDGETKFERPVRESHADHHDHPSRLERRKEKSARTEPNSRYFERECNAKTRGKEALEMDSGSEETFSGLEDAMWESDSDEVRSRQPRVSGADSQRNINEVGDYDFSKRENNRKLDKAGRANNTDDYERQLAVSDESETEDVLAEMGKWRPDDLEESESNPLCEADDDYGSSFGETDFHATGKVDRVARGRNSTVRDDDWDSD